MCHPVGFHFSSVWSCSAITCQMILHWNNTLGNKIIYFECSSRTINELILEDLNLRGYDTVAGWVVPGVAKERSAFIVKGQTVHREYLLFILGYLILEDEGTKLLCNIRKHLPSRVSYPGRHESSKTLLWEPKISDQF